MVTRTFSRASYENERSQAKAKGIDLPEAGQTQEVTYGIFTFEVATTVIDNGDVTVTGTVTHHPKWIPESLIYNEIESRL